MKKTFRKGGIHPAANKTAATGIEVLPLPMTAYVPLSQHIGAPARPVVSKGEHVSRGSLIAEPASFISAAVHAPISGTVAAIEQAVSASGKPMQMIIIKASEADHAADTEARLPLEVEGASLNRGLDLSPEELRRRISAAGIVGLGGATFPTHVKLSVRPEQTVEVLIINGCECEPYLMCDDALMCACPDGIVAGARLMMKASGARRAVIALEDNKAQAAEALRAALSDVDDISLEILQTKYPQGGEKQLVEAVTGRRIASGALPLSVGAIVANVATAFAVFRAVALGEALTERVVTVTGDIPAEQRKNYLVAIGTPLAELPFTMPQECRAIVGGPMMGRTAVRLDAPVTKGTSGLTLLEGRMRRQALACIRCGACVEACPMGLEPYLLSDYGRLRMFDEAREVDVADCLECGACSWSCPSYRPLLDYIRVAKQRSRK